MTATTYILEFIFVLDVSGVSRALQATGTAYFDNLNDCLDAAQALMRATQDEITRMCERSTK